MKRLYGFTLVELLVVISIIAVLVAILMPAVQRVRASARSAQSKNNLSEMGVAMKHYEGLGRGNLRTANWEQTLAPFVDDAAAIYVDPSDDDGDASYALSNKVVLMGGNDDKKIAIIESDDRIIDLDTENCTAGGQATIAGTPTARHMGMTNALLYGGSVRSFEPTDIDLADTSKEPLVVWWLPDREHGYVCGSVVVVDNPNELPEPSSTEPDAELNPEPASGPGPTETQPCEPVLHLTFNDPNDLGRDISGKSHHGTAYGGPGYDASVGGGAIIMDGSNDYIEIAHHADLMPQSELTITFWIKYENGMKHNYAYSKRPDQNNAGYNCNTWPVVGPTETQNYFHVGGSWYTTNVSYPADNQWCHAAVTYDGSAIRTYVNGALAETASAGGGGDIDDAGTINLQIGRNSYLTALCSAGGCPPEDAWGSLQGRMDDFRMYRCVLDASDISTIYNDRQ